MTSTGVGRRSVDVLFPAWTNAARSPTLALRLVRAARFRRRTLTARIAPARDASEAARVAAALSGG